MYAFLDKDKKQINVKEKDVDQVLEQADQFRKYRFPNDNMYSFHQTRSKYWEDFYTQLYNLKTQNQ